MEEKEKNERKVDVTAINKDRNIIKAASMDIDKTISTLRGTLEYRRRIAIAYLEIGDSEKAAFLLESYDYVEKLIKEYLGL